jgi:hypothetical protein
MRTGAAPWFSFVLACILHNAKSIRLHDPMSNKLWRLGLASSRTTAHADEQFFTNFSYPSKEQLHSVATYEEVRAIGSYCADIHHFGRNVSIDDHFPKPETKSARKNDTGKCYIKSCDFQKILVRNLIHDFVPFKIYVYLASHVFKLCFSQSLLPLHIFPIMVAHQLVFLMNLGFENASFIQLLGLAKVGSAHTCCDVCTVSVKEETLIFSSKIHLKRNLRLVVNLVQYACTR